MDAGFWLSMNEKERHGAIHRLGLDHVCFDRHKRLWLMIKGLDWILQLYMDDKHNKSVFSMW